MTKTSKIGLGVIITGAKNQIQVNRDQFSFLKKELIDFDCHLYFFNALGKLRLKKDYKNRKIKVVLKNAYGRDNEATVERWLEKKNMRFFGSGSTATLIGTSKKLSKSIFRKHDIPVVKDFIFSSGRTLPTQLTLVSKINRTVKFPCIIKDSAGTDSRGIFIAKNEGDLKKLYPLLKKNRTTFIVEQFLSHVYETTCFVGGGNARAYEPVGIELTNDIFSATAKDKGGVRTRIPIPLHKVTISKVKQIAVKAHSVLKCKGFSRSDFLIYKNRIYILETDVHPGFRAESPTMLALRYATVSLNSFFTKLYKSL